MVYHAIFITNHSGGLIYNRYFTEQSKHDINDALRLSSILHSVSAISRQISPLGGCQGIDSIHGDTFDLHCLHPMTGTKFFVLCDAGDKGAEGLLHGIHQLFGDFVMKEPFYVPEMPIRVEAFDENVVATVKAFNSAA